MRWATMTFVVSGSSFASPSRSAASVAVIERGERIVKHQNFRLPRQGAGDGQALLLPAGDVPAKLRDRVLRALRIFSDKLRRLRQRERVAQGFVRLRHSALAEEHVVLHCPGEEDGLLRHIAEPVIERVERIVLHVHAVD